MSNILSLTSWWRNKILIPLMSQNSELYSSGIPFWDYIAAPNFLLNTDKIWLVVCEASCVHLKDKTGFPSFLTGFMIGLMIVVTSHVALDFCFWYNLLLMIFAICLPLSRALRWLSVMFLFSASIGFVSPSFGYMSVSEINVFVWQFLLGEWRLWLWPNGLVPRFALC